MPESEVKKISLSDNMRRALADARRFSRGPLQRQLRLIAKLMPSEDLTAIQLELQRLKQPSKQQTAEFHQLEQWRDRLINGDENLLTDLIDQFENIDRQRIRQLVRNAGIEKKRNKAPNAARALFKYLAELKKHTSEVYESADDNPLLNTNP